MKGLNTQKGFTLIELVVVIVILGILAATAAPKFIDLQDDANTATLEAVKGSMQSASTLVYSKSLIDGVQNDATEDVTVNNSTLDVAYGYPLADYSSADGSWEDLIELDSNDFTGAVIGGKYVVTPGTDAPTAATVTCIVTYTQASGTGTPVVVTPPEIAVTAC